MRIDVHTHIFPPVVAAARERFFPNEPAFRTLYDSPSARLATAESLIEAMDRDGVDRSVVFGFPWHETAQAARHNDYVLESAARYAPRLIPLACVSLEVPESITEARRCLDQGAKGLGELAVYGACSEQDVLNIFRDLVPCCAATGGVLLVHANEPVGHAYPGKAHLGLHFYYALARLARGVPLILAHWGGGLCFYELLKREVADVLSSVYYDTAASPFLYRPEIYHLAARILRPGRILFGSDFPLLRPRRYFSEMSQAGLTAEQIDDLCGGSAARLFSQDLRLHHHGGRG
jgi:hypothetical protein